MNENIIEDARVKMRAAVESFNTMIAGIRTGVAHPGLVENLLVEVDPKSRAISKLKQMAAIRVVGGDLHIEPWDSDAVSSIQKAISESSLGLMPRVDSKAGKRVIFVSIPKLSEEYRKKLAKEVHATLEKARVDLRNVRRAFHDTVIKMQGNKKKDKTNTAVLLSEDEGHRILDGLDKLTEQFIKEAEDIATVKQRDLMH